ncbi:S46 family peptidase [Niabella beijingensis]|uniref:S46 family peptidase n=1 Tax=Niabella beijingensis TaxID=2872700 RepID=UPI001CC053AF|nr:S46 family peptidase [Niabella beijingensis]MBZ4189480.1 S46 family peptidase [Niabella beijingensis]
MKRRFLLLLVLVTAVFRSYADEGMWLPQLLGQQVYNDMVKKGLKLSKEQLYSINKNSLKDAIIIFGGGCTGEIVSPEGLIFTNHHCGYEAIAGASTVDHNFLRDGFYARNKGEEIKTSLSVQFLLRIEDVTKEVTAALGTLSGKERAAKQAEVLAAINGRMSDPANSIETRVSPLFKGNQFLAFVYERFSDIRLVGAPPEAVGKFGGDTDNWEWPRHTGDFSIFRVYANKQNKPAAYDPANVPLKPKWFLPVSLKGVKEGDFAMIWGYPGGTNRYESSYGIKLATEVNNPTLVALRDVRLKYMFEQMKKDPAIKLKLASSYAGIANYWKFFDGETKQLLKYDVYGQKKTAEDKFNAWAKGKPEYENIFSDWAKAYEDWKPFAKARVYLNEGILGSPLIGFAASLTPLRNALVTGATKEEVAKIAAGISEERDEFLKEEDTPSDQNILATVTQLFYENVDKSQQPEAFYNELQSKYGSLSEAATYKKYAADVFANSLVFNDAKWKSFIENPDTTVLGADPAFAQASAFIRSYQNGVGPKYQEFTAKNNDYGRLYLKGVMAMDPAKAKMMYPDATFTMRVSYGQVKAYKPRDAVSYDYVTTSKGILEKYKPGDYEYDLPAKQIELLKKKDFGQYADPVRKDLVIGFITSNDITGGNSGSPVINGNGELLGLAFDGNYEALSHKLAFDKDLNRTINVDIRYVLWCIDKLGGATNIINELKLVK